MCSFSLEHKNRLVSGNSRQPSRIDYIHDDHWSSKFSLFSCAVYFKQTNEIFTLASGDLTDGRTTVICDQVVHYNWVTDNNV